MPEFGQGLSASTRAPGRRGDRGIVMLYHGTQAIYWHGVSDAAHSRAHPAPLLLVSAIQAASAGPVQLVRT